MEPALSDVEEFQVELVDPECEQASELSMSENEPFEDEDDELVNEDDEFPEIACVAIEYNMSKMECHIWRKYGNITNMVEAVHALINKEGKQLKLMSAILWLFKIKDAHNNSGIPYSRYDKSKVKRQQNEFNRKITRFKKKINPNKRKLSPINITRKKSYRNASNQVVNETVVEIESDTNENNEIQMDNIELVERKMALLERKMKHRKEAAEVEAIELQNQHLKINLGLGLVKSRFILKIYEV
ncbi:43618_t:CDS:2 [Gigaspora margarita]|uniref:43618_t:CDS:1 n=1 Tax=Gigaspora margarita TaxID=4874 RepID=A0ABN7UI36_GIGMA|nr:43618_t:CDS:2 [Gigaspora margarita]